MSPNIEMKIAFFTLRGGNLEASGKTFSPICKGTFEYLTLNWIRHQNLHKKSVSDHFCSVILKVSYHIWHPGLKIATPIVKNAIFISTFGLMLRLVNSSDTLFKGPAKNTGSFGS